MRCVGVGERLERQTIATIGTGVKNNPGLEQCLEDGDRKRTVRLDAIQPRRHLFMLGSQCSEDGHSLAADNLCEPVEFSIRDRVGKMCVEIHLGLKFDGQWLP